jgi:hypothetical protein
VGTEGGVAAVARGEKQLAVGDRVTFHSIQNWPELNDEVSRFDERSLRWLVKFNKDGHTQGSICHKNLCRIDTAEEASMQQQLAVCSSASLRRRWRLAQGRLRQGCCSAAARVAGEEEARQCTHSAARAGALAR